MTPVPSARSGKANALVICGNAMVMWSSILIDRRWPGSTAALLTRYAWYAYFAAWFGFTVWTGYRRRRRYWTSDSWRRYLRLAAIPVMALIGVFVEMYFFDTKRNWSVWGAPGSGVRTVWIVVDLAVMAFGAIGGMMAVDWMASGEPSAQFTRTHWFRRRRRSAIAD